MELDGSPICPITSPSDFQGLWGATEPMLWAPGMEGPIMWCGDLLFPVVTR